MSNVRIEAIGDEGLSVEILLGDANRAWRDIEAGDFADLAVGGNQTLKIGPAREPESVFVTPDDEPAVTTPFVEGQDELPIGVDVLAAGQEAPTDPAADAEVITPADIGSVEDLGIIKDLEADSPLEVGAITDLPNPFEASGDVEAESEDETPAQA